MKYNRNKAYDLLQEFNKFCKENKIWYSADDHTLLGAVRHAGFVPWFEKIQVMMTPDSYRKLLRLRPKQVIDSSIINGFNSLKAAYVKNAAKWDVETPFIEIRILVPTTIKKIKKFTSKTRITMSHITFKKDNIRHAINDLYTQVNEGFYIVENRWGKASKYWIPNVSFETSAKKLGPTEIEVLKESEELLKIRFGKKYMDAKVPNRDYIFSSPNKSLKEKL